MKNYKLHRSWAVVAVEVLSETSTRALHRLRKLTLCAVLVAAPAVQLGVAQAAEINLALNLSRTGYPSPLASSSGWGGGPEPWELVDGLRTYDEWYHGLAFTGGHTGGADSGGWVEAAGPRQATIDFGTPKTFHKVVVWHHGEDHAPDVAQLHYWDGNSWVQVAATRLFGASQAGGAGSWSDEYTFAPVTGSQVRWSFDNRGNNVLGTPIVHGWLYEFEVFGEDAAKPDLVVQEETGNKGDAVGSPFNYSLTLSNIGSGTATAVRLNDLLPAAAEVTSVISSLGEVQETADQISCHVGTLTPGGRVTVTVRGVIRCAGSGNHLARAEAAEVESNVDNNTVSSVVGSTSGAENLAANPSGSGYPSPLESDRGWGGGSYPWEIVDGLQTYADWPHGLAWTGGHTGGADSSGWIEAAGPRQATIAFGAERTFNKVVIWQHGSEHTPANANLEYWDGSKWTAIGASRVFGAVAAGGAGAWSDEYTFAPVTGTKVRWSFDNREDNIVGTPNIHGWIYEFEVFGGAECAGVSLAVKRLVAVEIRGHAGGRYRIEYTPALADPPVWTLLSEVTLTSEKQLVVDFDSADEGARFYRAVEAD